jgi:hypothetical protein
VFRVVKQLSNCDLNAHVQACDHGATQPSHICIVCCLYSIHAVSKCRKQYRWLKSLTWTHRIGVVICQTWYLAWLGRKMIWKLTWKKKTWDLTRLEKKNYSRLDLLKFDLELDLEIYDLVTTLAQSHFPVVSFTHLLQYRNECPFYLSVMRNLIQNLHVTIPRLQLSKDL